MTICDFSCSGPTLLKVAKKKFPNAKLFAYNSERPIGLKLKRILEKELGDSVNIIEEMKDNIKFDKIIMNPPYDKNLHLKILREAMRHIEKEGGEIVSLEPDIFFPYKCQLSAYKEAAFMDLKLKEVERLPYEMSDKMFNIGNSLGGLAIYHLTENGGHIRDDYTFNNDIEKSLYNKVLCKRKDKLNWENEHTQRRAAQNEYEVDLYTWHKGKDAYTTCIREDGKSNRSVTFSSKEEVENFKNSFRTKFMEWYVKNIIWAGNGIVDKCFMFDTKIYENVIDDKFFWDFFALNEEEIKEIENAI